MNPYPNKNFDFSKAIPSTSISDNLAVPITETTSSVNLFISIYEPQVSHDLTVSLIHSLIATDKNLQTTEVHHAE